MSELQPPPIEEPEVERIPPGPHRTRPPLTPGRRRTALVIAIVADAVQWVAFPFFMSGGASVAFSLKIGEISGPVANGNTGVVLSVTEKQEPTPQDFDAKKDQIRDALIQNQQQEMFGLFVSNLRAQMEKAGKIQINADEMKNLTRSQAAPEQGE